MIQVHWLYHLGSTWQSGGEQRRMNLTCYDGQFSHRYFGPELLQINNCCNRKSAYSINLPFADSTRRAEVGRYYSLLAQQINSAQGSENDKYLAELRSSDQFSMRVSKGQPTNRYSERLALMDRFLWWIQLIDATLYL